MHFIAPLKNDETCVVKSASFVMDILACQWKDQAAQRMRTGDRWQNQKDRETALMFTAPEGNDISPTSIRYHFKGLVTEIGVPSCRGHDLRHTFAVLFLQNRDDVKTVQTNLGHAAAAFTLDVSGMSPSG